MNNRSDKRTSKDRRILCFLLAVIRIALLSGLITLLLSECDVVYQIALSVITAIAWGVTGYIDGLADSVEWD